MTDKPKRDGKNVYMSKRAYAAFKKQAKKEGYNFKAFMDILAKDIAKGAQA